MNKFKRFQQSLAVLLMSFLVFSCSEDDDTSNSSFNLENQIYLSFVNSSGQNLLERSTSDSYNVNDMNLFYLVDNEPVEVTVENGFNMGNLEMTSKNVLKVFTNPSSVNVIEEAANFQVVENTSILQLTETDIDTIKTHATNSLNYFKISQVWYNEKLVWTSESDEVIEIIK